MSNEGGVPSPSSWLADEGLPRPPPGDNHCKIDWVGASNFQVLVAKVDNLMEAGGQGAMQQ